MRQQIVRDFLHQVTEQPAADLRVALLQQDTGISHLGHMVTGVVFQACLEHPCRPGQIAGLTVQFRQRQKDLRGRVGVQFCLQGLNAGLGTRAHHRLSLAGQTQTKKMAPGAAAPGAVVF